jgi:hypothetical protein
MLVLGDAIASITSLNSVEIAESVFFYCRNIFIKKDTGNGEIGADEVDSRVGPMASSYIGCRLPLLGFACLQGGAGHGECKADEGCNSDECELHVEG